MKKFLYGCLIVLIAVLCSAALNVTLSSCENSPVSKFVTPTVNKAQVSLCIDSLINPNFGEFSDVINLKRDMVTTRYTDSVFLSIPDKTLKDVYTVLSKKITHVNKDDIVAEFISNRAIYENLPPNSADEASNAESSTTSITTTEQTAIPGIVREGTTTVMEAQQTGVVDPAGSYKDTVINGKHALIKQ